MNLKIIATCCARLLLYGNKWLPVVTAFFICPVSYAQTLPINYAREVIDTLTSFEMNGRGYVDSGDFKAAVFLKNEFENLQLKTFSQNYFQSFSFSTNTFPGKMEVTLDKKKLIAGKDFLIDAASVGVRGKFKVWKLPKSHADTTLDAVSKMVEWLIEIAGKKNIVSISKDDFTARQWAMLDEQIQKYNGFGVKGYLVRSSLKLTWHSSQDAMSYCMLQVFDTIGNAEPEKIKLNIESQFKEQYLTRNVAAYSAGISQPDSFLVFTAHYDHLGQMGDGTYFPGANDNASGVSMVLNLAKYFAANPNKYSVAFILFSGEEAGLLGSYYYTSHPLFPMEKIKFLINLDIVGTGDEGIKVVNATEYPDQFQGLVKLNEEEQLLKTVSPRGPAANSDHYPFYKKGIPCFFIYTMGGISAYHDIYDRAETLPLTEYEDLMKLLIDFTKLP